MDWLQAIEPWHWLAAGLILAALETMAPGVYLIWFGVSAMLVGGVTWAMDLSWQVEMVMFSVFSAISIVAWIRFGKGDDFVNDHPQLNERGQQYIGKVFTVAVAIEDGNGKVKVGDGLWKARGANAAEGSKVRVTAVDGVIFEVEPVE